MRRSRTGRVILIATVLALVCASPSSSNPVPNGVDRSSGYELRALMWPIAEGDAGAEMRRFAELVGQFGLTVFTAEDIRVISSHFDRFEPLFIEAQRLGVGAEPWSVMHDMFDEHASYQARRDMSDALRPWLLADTLSISLAHRVAAAEYLADYRDVEVLPLIAALIDTLRERPVASGALSTAEASRYLELAARRVHEPDAGLVLRCKPGADTALVREPGGVRVATYAGDLVLSGEQALFALECLRTARVERRARQGFMYEPRSIRIVFEDGVVVRIMRRRGDRYTYEDNHRFTGHQLALVCPRLSELFDALETVRPPVHPRDA